MVEESTHSSVNVTAGGSTGCVGLNIAVARTGACIQNADATTRAIAIAVAHSEVDRFDGIVALDTCKQ
jgi:hypothetical protein